MNPNAYYRSLPNRTGLLRAGRRALLAGACLSLVAWGAVSTARGAVYTWIAPGGGDWNTASNWSSAPNTGTAPQNGNQTVNVNPNGGTVTGNPTGGDDNFRFLNFDNGVIQDHDRANANNVGTWNIGDGNVGNGSASFQFNGAGTFRGGEFNVHSDGEVTATNILIGHVSSAAPATLNVNGGSVTASGFLQWNNYQGTINLLGGSLNIGGNVVLSGGTAATRAINVYAGSLTAGQYTVNGWDTGEHLAFNITGNLASLIQFTQWNLDDNAGGTGDLSYTLVTGQSITPISLTDVLPFGNNAANFSNNFTLRIHGGAVQPFLDQDLVLFSLTNANNFNGLSQLRFDDLLGNSLRGDGDLISIAANGGVNEFFLRFSNLRPGNLSGDLEIWLESYIPPVPEPSSLVLLSLGLIGLQKQRRRGGKRH